MDPPRPNISVNVQIRSCSAICVWLSLSVLIQTGLDHGHTPDNLSLIFAVLGTIGIVLVVYYMEIRVLSSFCRFRVSQIEQEQTFSKFVYSMCVLIERSVQIDYRFELHCVMRIIKDDLLQIGVKTTMIENCEMIITNEIPQLQDMRAMSYKILGDLIDLYRNRFKNAMYLGLVNAYILHTKLDLKWKAIYEVQDILSESRETRIKFSADLFVRQIEAEMMEFEIRNRESDKIDVVSLMDFQEKFANFNEQIMNAYELYYEFWMQLAKIKPNVKQIKSVGTKINIINQEIKKAFDEMMEKSSNQAKTILLYGHFLRLVVNDEEEANKLITRGTNLQSSTQNNRSYMESSNLRHADSSSLSIIVASGDQRTLGQIKSFNSEALKLFEYTAEELNGANVEMLMPKIYAENHEKWMRRYFKDNRGSVMNTERVVYSLNRRGFVVPVNVTYRAKYSCCNVDVLAIMSRVAGEGSGLPIVLIDSVSGLIVGISVECYIKYGLHPGIVYSDNRISNALHIQQMLPSVQNPSDLLNLNKILEINTLDLTRFENHYQNTFSYPNLLGMKSFAIASDPIFSIKLSAVSESYTETSLNIIKLSIIDISAIDIKQCLQNDKNFPEEIEFSSSERDKLTSMINNQEQSQEFKEGTNAMNLTQDRDRVIQEKRSNKGRSVYNGLLILLYITSTVLLIVLETFLGAHLNIHVQAMNQIELNFESLTALSIRQEMLSIIVYYARRVHLSSVGMVSEPDKSLVFKSSKNTVESK